MTDLSNTYSTDVAIERPLSEGDNIKVAIRTLFETSRDGAIYTEENPLRRVITNVNGSKTATLCLIKHPTKHGAVVLWYEWLTKLYWFFWSLIKIEVY